MEMGRLDRPVQIHRETLNHRLALANPKSQANHTTVANQPTNLKWK
jgi:hypothetical protein